MLQKDIQSKLENKMYVSRGLMVKQLAEMHFIIYFYVNA